MRFYEYEAKALFARHGTPLLKGRVARTAVEARQIAAEVAGPVVLKSQVLTGGRMKAGGVKFADTPAEAEVAARVILARPVGGAEQEKIAQALGRAIGRRVRLEMDVDENILGGLVAKVGSEIFDASVRHAVERFAALTKERAGA